MNKNEKIHIIVGEEKNKEELIYNNVVKHLNLSNHDEIKYLKGRVSTLEEKLKVRMFYTLILLFGFLSLCFSIILLIFDLYIPGIILIFTTFLFVIIKLSFHFRDRLYTSSEFDKVDQLKKLLEEKLK